MPTMEHHDALEMLKTLFADCEKGRGRVVLIEGGLASGKTYLLHEFESFIEESGAKLLRATGSRAEQNLQMGVIDQLFAESLPDKVAGVLAEDIGKHAGQGEQHYTQHNGFRGVRELCGAILDMTKDRPVVVMVDDVHFTDTASLRVLLSLQRRMASARLMLVLNEWARSHHTLPMFYAELTRHPHHRIRLAPMSIERITQLITETLGERHAETLAKHYHDLTLGNPMLIQALLEDHRAADLTEEEDDGEPVIGMAYAQAVLACLHRWEPQLLDVARAVAVLGEWSTPQMISRMLRMRPELVDDILQVLTDAGLLDGARFRTPLSQCAVLESLGTTERVAMHQRAADLLFQHGATCQDVAAHLLAAGHAEEEWARTVLRNAASHALAQKDLATAVRCLEIALESCRDPRERIAILNLLVRVLWRLNPSSAAPYLGELQAAVQDGHLVGRDAATVVRYLLWKGDYEVAAKTLDALLAAPHPIDPQSMAELAVTYHWFYGSTMERWASFDVSMGKDLWAETTHRLARLWTRDGLDAAAVSAQHILQSSNLEETTIEVIAMAMMALVSSGKVDQAYSWCEHLLREASRRGDVTWQAILNGINAGLILRHGDLNGAVQQAKAALELLPEQGWGVVIGQPRATLLQAYTRLGQYEAALEVLQQHVPDEMFGTVFSLHYLHSRGHYYLAVGQALAASRDFHLCSKLMREWDVDVPILVPWRSDLAEAYLQLGRKAEARDLAKQQLERSKSVDPRTRGISLRVLAAASDLHQRPALLRQAVEHLHTANDRLELSRTLTDFSLVYQELGEFERARALARRATHVTQGAVPAVPPNTGPQRKIPIHGTEEQHHPVLSDAELRVAELAALGHTNREISRALFITVSTVEQHLTRVYRKLGVTRRTDLHTELMRGTNQHKLPSTG